MVLGVKLFPASVNAGKAVLPKSATGSISNFFSGKSGSIAKNSLKVGGTVGAGGFLASLGIGSLGDSFKNFAENTGLDPQIVVIIAVVILILFLFVVLKKR